MESLEKLFSLEIEFQRRLRKSSGTPDPSSLHTSYALQAGYEPLIRRTNGVTLEQIEKMAQRLALSGDARDVLSAKDSLIDLFGVRRRGLD